MTTVPTGGAGAPPTPEKIVRKRTPIPQRPSTDDVKGIIGEIARQRNLDRELEIVLQHMIQVVFDRFDDIWEALEILDKRYDEFEDEDLFDTKYTEISRVTTRRERTVTSNDGDVEVDLLDVITQRIRARGNKTGRVVEFIFNEPMPV